MNINDHINTSLKSHQRIITIFILTTLMAILLVGATLRSVLERMTLDSWRKRQEFVTLEFAPQCEFEMKEAIGDLQFLSKLHAFSTLPYVDQIDRSIMGIPGDVDVEKREIIEELLEPKGKFSSLIILRPNGDLYLVHPFHRQIKSKKYNFSDRPYFKEAVRTGKPVISDSFISGSGVTIVLMIVPVINSKDVLTSFICGAFYLKDISRLVNSDQIGDFNKGFIVDRKGHLIAHTDTGLLQEKYRKKYIDHDLVSLFLKQPGASPSTVTIRDCIDPIDGKNYLTSFVPLFSGWGLALALEKKTILSEIRPIVWRITILVSSIILVVGGTGALFTRWIGKRWIATEESLMIQTHKLNERVKELNCLYSISKTMDNPEKSQEQMIWEIINIIPHSWQYPEITCCRIITNEKIYKTENFKETPFKQSSKIVLNKKEIGALEIFYIKERPESFEGPFMKEERHLINEITDRISFFIGRNQAEKKIKASLGEKEILLRELYHRTKNNMQMIISLINLQSQHIDDEDVLRIFKETKNRISSMALVHEKLYQTKRLSRINLGVYFKDLLELLARSYRPQSRRIVIKKNLSEVKVDIDSAIPCGLIVNELISNAFKYAFPQDRSGEICVSLSMNEYDEISLIVGDDGVGLPDDFDFRNAPSLGLRTVVSLVEQQLSGSIRLRHEKGTYFYITFGEAI